MLFKGRSSGKTKELEEKRKKEEEERKRRQANLRNSVSDDSYIITPSYSYSDPSSSSDSGSGSCD